MDAAKKSGSTATYWARKDEKTHVVFLGNGYKGGPCKGHAPTGYRKMLKALASRSIVLLVDEFRTSKLCCTCRKECRQLAAHPAFAITTKMGEQEIAKIKRLRHLLGRQSFGFGGGFLWYENETSFQDRSVYDMQESAGVGPVGSRLWPGQSAAPSAQVCI